jgi:hypothetical protein
MKSKLSNTLLAVLAVVLSIFLGTGITAFGQGRGHGGGRPGGGPPPMPQGGGGGGRQQVFNPPQRQQPPPQRMNPVQAQRPMPQQQQPRGWQMPQHIQQPRPQPQPQQRSWQMPQRQMPQRIERPQPQQRVWQIPQQRAQPPRPQPQQDRGWQRQAPRIEPQRPQQSAAWQNRGGWQRQDHGLRAQQQKPEIFDRGRGQQMWRNRSDNGIANNEWRGRGRSEASWANAGRIPPGLIRSQEVHERNAERQAWRADQNRGGYGDNNWYGGYRGDNYDRQSRWDDRRREFWRENSLRNVIGDVLGGYSGSYYDYPGYYYSPYYGTPYNTTYYTVNYFGYPQYSSYYGYPLYFTTYYYPSYLGYYDPYYYSDYYDPYYVSYYDPFDSGYYDPYYSSYYYDSNYGFSSPYYYNYQPFAYYTQAGYYNPYSDYAGGDYCSLRGGGSYSSWIEGPSAYSQLLASGYDQGYSDGLYARNNNYGDRYFYDPYVYEDAGYDPYSYSLGANRRCLSEGYKLGYRDALYGRDQYRSLYGGGNVDLVSLLAGSVLQTVWG